MQVVASDGMITGSLPVTRMLLVLNVMIAARLVAGIVITILIKLTVGVMGYCPIVTIIKE